MNLPPHPFSDAKPPQPNPLAVVIVVVLWLAAGCALPLYQVREARRQAREKMADVLAADRLDKAGVLALFERANQDLDAAASGPCLLLSMTGICLAWQLLKLKRRFNEVDLDLRICRSHGAPSEAESPD